MILALMVNREWHLDFSIKLNVKKSHPYFQFDARCATQPKKNTKILQKHSHQPENKILIGYGSGCFSGYGSGCFSEAMTADGPAQCWSLIRTVNINLHNGLFSLAERMS
jgi:hypothetical protein